MNEAGCCCCPHAALVVWYRYPYLRRFIPIFAGEVLCQFSTVTRLICCYILYIFFDRFPIRTGGACISGGAPGSCSGQRSQLPLPLATSSTAPWQWQIRFSPGYSLVRAPVLSAASPLACPVSTHVADASVPFCSFSF